MVTVHTLQFAGPPSPLATAQVVQTDHGVAVALSISGPNAASIVHAISDKIKHTHVDTPSSFLSLLERVKEQWGELLGELSAIFVLGEKTYLVCYNAEVWLHRGEKFGRVLKSSNELKVVEGRALVHDTYYCFTQSAAVASLNLLTQASEGHLAEVQLFEALQSSTEYTGLLDRTAVAKVILSEPHHSQNMVTQTVVAVESSQLSKKILPFLKQAASVLIKSAKRLPQYLQQAKQLRNARLSGEMRKKVGIVLVVVCALCVLLLGFSLWRSSEIKKGQTFLLPFSQRLSELKSLAQTDSVAARDQTLVLQKEFESSKSSVDQGMFTKQSVADFSSQLQAFVKEVSGKVELQTLPVFYDFRLVRSDFLATRADLEENTAIFLDQEKQVAIALTVDTKQQTILPIGEYASLKDISFTSEQVYMLSDGVYQFPLSSQISAKKIIEEGDSNRSGKFLRVFGEYYYVFNPEKRNMYRYVIGEENKVSDPIGWFQDKKDLDFSTVSSVSVDGTVWLGTEQGQILQYERGNPVDFVIQGLSEPFTSNVKVFTKENLDSIFVLESGKNRAVRLSKEGVFLKEIHSPSLGAATEILFSPQTNKAYAVAGSLVYELAL